MPTYETLFKPHRLTLDYPRPQLSAGLSPRVFFSTPALNERKYDLVTFTSPEYLMGGAYLWQQLGMERHPETGSPVPYFREGVPLPFDTMFPYEGHPELGVNYSAGRFVIYRREWMDHPTFQEHEELSKKFGFGFIKHQGGTISSCKLEIRDFIGNGLPDVIIGENNWDGNYRKSGKKGKKPQKV